MTSNTTQEYILRLYKFNVKYEHCSTFKKLRVVSAKLFVLGSNSKVMGWNLIYCMTGKFADTYFSGILGKCKHYVLAKNTCPTVFVVVVE